MDDITRNGHVWIICRAPGFFSRVSRTGGPDAERPQRRVAAGRRQRVAPRSGAGSPGESEEVYEPTARPDSVSDSRQASEAARSAPRSRWPVLSAVRARIALAGHEVAAGVILTCQAVPDDAGTSGVVDADGRWRSFSDRIAPPRQLGVAHVARHRAAR